MNHFTCSISTPSFDVSGSMAYLSRARADIVTPRVLLRVLLVICDLTRGLCAYKLASGWPILDDFYLIRIRRVCPSHCSVRGPKVYADHDPMELFHRLFLALSAVRMFYSRRRQLPSRLSILQLSASTRLPRESSADPKQILY